MAGQFAQLEGRTGLRLGCVVAAWQSPAPRTAAALRPWCAAVLLLGAPRPPEGLRPNRGSRLAVPPLRHRAGRLRP
jgi:hypothetical protein